MESFHPNAHEDDNISEDEDMSECTANLSHFSNKITKSEYEQQRRDFTRQQIAILVSSPEYTRRLNTCGTCWSPWLDLLSCDDCMECGGFPLVRPCPVCKGKCGKTWQRDVETSHSNHEAHWEGNCGLPWDQQRLHLQLILTEDAGEEAILEAMQTLTTRQTSIEGENVPPVSYGHWNDEIIMHQHQLPQTLPNYQIVGNDVGHWYQEPEVKNSTDTDLEDVEMQL